jgi:hypothetical protein
VAPFLFRRLGKDCDHWYLRNVRHSMVKVGAGGA